MKLQTKDYCNKRLKSINLPRLPIVNDIIFRKVIKRSLNLLSRQNSVSVCDLFQHCAILCLK